MLQGYSQHRAPLVAAAPPRPPCVGTNSSAGIFPTHDQKEVAEKGCGSQSRKGEKYVENNSYLGLLLWENAGLFKEKQKDLKEQEFLCKSIISQYVLPC